MRSFILIAGLLLLFAVEFLRVYFIMPFPGSQHKDTLQFAYWLSNNIRWIRIVLLLVIAMPVISTLSTSVRWKRITLFVVLIFYGIVFFLFNFRLQADKMFYQPSQKTLATSKENKIALDKLVIGIVINGDARAYPIQLIGYHHQVKDTVGNIPAIITYCTVCRTGRVYSPTVDGRLENFRLVGMDHFNAMFEDATTKSWWQQATGVAVAGPLKGAALKEFPSQQLTLGAWLRLHPSSLIMQPDSLYKKDYDDLVDFDKGTLKSNLEKRDSASWQNKSWVIGIQYEGVSKAYDWNALVKERILEDSVSGLPVLLVLEKDTATFHAWNRSIDSTVLNFEKSISNETFRDKNTGSVWNMDGTCIDGIFKGKMLRPVQAYQEFWHSWKTFHPNTIR